MMRQLWAVVVSVGSLVATLAVAPLPARAGQPGAERRAMVAALDQLVADGFPAAVAYGRVDGRRWQVAAGMADRATGARARPDDRPGSPATPRRSCRQCCCNWWARVG
ncbi:hypothetical protein AB0B57_28905 [Micromonospora sp. NPDC049101]|uniref:hypothetical protein n=1 Tax=Micromonospora sp. NPDC049101 TaxID=3155032 RepID=UPI0033E6F11F